VKEIIKYKMVKNKTQLILTIDLLSQRSKNIIANINESEIEYIYFARQAYEKAIDDLKFYESLKTKYLT